MTNVELKSCKTVQDFRKKIKGIGEVVYGATASVGSLPNFISLLSVEVSEEKLQESLGSAQVKLMHSPEVLGIRTVACIADDGATYVIDVAIEYSWNEPIGYLVDDLALFIEYDTIPRLFTLMRSTVRNSAGMVGKNIDEPFLELEAEFIDGIRGIISEQSSPG